MSGMNRFRVDGKKALVTGATAGIGRAAAIALAEAGADVAVIGRRDLSDLCNQIRTLGHEALPITGDLAETAFIQQAVDGVLQQWNQIDILVNSAGTIARAPAAEFPAEEWDRIIALNLTSLFHISQQVGRVMISQRSGKIINVASIVSFIGGMNVAAYTASKGGVAQLTKALANEWARHNVNVNAVAPGFVLTEMTQPLFDDPVRSKELMSRVPAQRWGTPEDISGAVVFLASPASDFVNGHLLVVDGGWMAS